MNIAIVDPSCFTMPYDHALCEALAVQGCGVTFIGSRYLYGTWNYRAKYRRVNLFYNSTNYLYDNRTEGLLRKEVKGVEHLVNMYGLTKYLMKLQPTIIHFQWIPFPMADAPFLKMLKNIAPTVLTVHDIHPYHAAQSSKLQLTRFSSTMRQFDHLIVHTRTSHRLMNVDFNIPADKVSIIPHGLFDQYLKMPHSDVALETKRMIILFFGAIKPYKGLDNLIRAFARLPRRILEETTLLIAGNPKMEVTPLLNLARDLKVSTHIQWKLGYIPDDEVGGILKKATIFVLPHKHFEAQSGALMAMIPFCKPIIATKVGGFADVLVDGIHGYLVERNNVQALATAIEKVLSDRSRRKRMEKALGELNVKDLSWDSVAARTIRLYETLSLPFACEPGSRHSLKPR